MKIQGLSAKPHGTKGIKRLVKALGWSWLGLKHAFIHETAFRQELILTIFLGPLGLWLGNGAVEKIMLAGSLLLVLIVELLNSAVEKIVDRISEEIHPLAGQAKDMGSAAVLISLINAVLTWTVVLIF